MFEHIILEPVQEELLVTLVEAARNTPLDQRCKFLLYRLNQGDFIVHPAVPEDKKKVYFGDIEALVREDLLALGYGSSDFDVTPLGFKYYEYLKKRAGQSVERVEATIRQYLETHSFQGKYPSVFEKWRSAEDLLWRTDTEQQLTTIGHLCREAIQTFVTILVEKSNLPGIDQDKSHTVARLRTVLVSKISGLGSDEKAFLEALIAYWGTVSDLIQRQEHGALKEGDQLIWEDARRVIFQTAILMFEIDSALTRIGTA